MHSMHVPCSLKRDSLHNGSAQGMLNQSFVRLQNRTLIANLAAQSRASINLAKLFHSSVLLDLGKFDTAGDITSTTFEVSTQLVNVCPESESTRLNSKPP